MRRGTIMFVLDPIIDFLNALGIAAPGRSGWVMVILTFVIAGVAAWQFMPRLRVFSLLVGWADKPNARRLNQEPLPNAGGLAIFAAVMVALVITTIFRPIEIEDVQIQVLAILLGGSFMIMAGFIEAFMTRYTDMPDIVRTPPSPCGCDSSAVSVACVSVTSSVTGSSWATATEAINASGIAKRFI